MTEFLNKEALELAKDPKLLFRIKKDLDKGIAGEDRTKLLLFLIAVSSFTRKPLGAIVTGESSSGKSYVVNQVLKYFSNVERFSRITKAAPDRLGQNFDGRILYIDELRGAEAAQASLRVWISEGSLHLLTTELDENGKIVTKEIETNGTPVFITTHAGTMIDEELLNRVFLVSIDESKKQTRAVMDFEAEEFMDPHFDDRLEPDPVICKFLEILQPWDVKIPFAKKLAEYFPADSVKARRDFRKLLNLIYVCAFLHQYQRPMAQDPKDKTKTFILAMPEDFLIVWRLASESMRNTLLNLQQRFVEVLELFENEENIHTSKSVAAATNLSQNRAREILNYLVARGFLLVDESERPYKYFLKKKFKLDTMNKIVPQIMSFGEKDLKEYLSAFQLNARPIGAETFEEPTKRLLLKPLDFIVDPINGQPLHSLYIGRALQNPEKNKEKALTPKNSIRTSTILPIVPNSKHIVKNGGEKGKC